MPQVVWSCGRNAILTSLISKNSGWIVVEWIPSLWKNSFTFSANFIYSDKFLHLQKNFSGKFLVLACVNFCQIGLSKNYLIWAEAIILSPANCHTWNSWTAKTPSTLSNSLRWIASTWICVGTVWSKINADSWRSGQTDLKIKTINIKLKAGSM